MTQRIYAGPIDKASHGALLGEGVGVDLIDFPVLPGHLVHQNEFGTITRGGNTLSTYSTLIAKEKGNHLGATINTPYDKEGELVTYIKVRSGEYVWVRASTGTNVSGGAPLTADAETGNVKNTTVAGEHAFLVCADLEITGYPPMSTVLNSPTLILAYKP